MRHSLRLRLIAVNAILPMLTIAAAGWYIHDANTTARGAGATFSTIDGQALTSGTVDIQSFDSAGLQASRIINYGGQSADLVGTPPFTLSAVCNFPTDGVSAGIVGATTIDTTATRVPVGSGGYPGDPFQPVPIVYTANNEPADQFVVVSQPAFVQAIRADQASTLDTLNLKALLAIGLAGLVCGAVGMVASQRIIRPVEALTGAARRLENGDLSQRVDHTSRDEIGQLSHAFNAMAESLQRTETLRKTMTSDVAHELRTPLNNIAGFVDMLADGLVEPDDRVLATLQDETQLLVTLVDDLEQLAIGDAGRLVLDTVETPLEPVVERAIHAMTPRALDRQVTLAFESTNPATATIDTRRIDQVLRNLLENAIRHTPEGGIVTVTLDATSITVADTGPGIDPAHLPYVFERFYRADSSRTRRTGGSGLGLAIAKQLIEAHQGTITATNRHPHGAQFIITL